MTNNKEFANAVSMPNGNQISLTMNKIIIKVCVVFNPISPLFSLPSASILFISFRLCSILLHRNFSYVFIIEGSFYN